MPRKTTPLQLKMVRIVCVLLAVILGTTFSSANAIAQTDSLRVSEQALQEQDARDFAVSMLDTSFESSRQAAITALSGSEHEWSAYVNGGREEAQLQDLRQILTTLSTVGGQQLQEQANRLLQSGSTDEISNFIDTGWQEAQRKDDRAQAWQAAQAEEGTSLKSAADKALREDTVEALSEFAAQGEDEARANDKRREVYELVDSELPTVSANASEALRIGTDTAIDEFLRYGQYVAADQDAEHMTVSQLVDLTIKESKTATEENNKAWMQADRAARAAEAARVATERSRDEALAADSAQQRAGNAATAAGKLATQSANMADQAVAASHEARAALQETAAALSRAAAASARAQSAAAQAASAANAAAYDAAAARGARVAAENARNAAQAARQSQQAYRYAEEAAGHAQSAGQAAGSAARNADAAAAAASDAANAAGVSQQAANEARAGAARARAAAGRARAAANEVDRIVATIRSLVEQTRKAAREAAEHAEKSARAADDAAREAGNAHYAAQFAGQHAQLSSESAERARNNIQLAKSIHEQALTAAEERLRTERDFLKDQARLAREVQDTTDANRNQEEQRRNDLTQKMEEIRSSLPADESEFTPSENAISDLRQLALSAAQVGTPSVAGAAKVALSGNNEEDLIEYAFNAYPDAVHEDNLNLVSHWALNDPNEEIRNAADEAGYEDDVTIDEFVNVTVPEMRIPGLIEQAWALRDEAGPQVQTAADAALKEGTFTALDEFINKGGYEKARYLDQLQQAYALTDTGGEEVKIAAEAAVTGDRQQLNEFISVEQYRRAMLDEQRNAHNAEIDALLSAGQYAAEIASQQAANAQQAHKQATGDAQRAAEYARQAQRWAGSAQHSAQQAQNHVASADKALSFALQQQQRAHQAANSAEADANQAESNADQAASYAATAQSAAQAAATSAASARQSANAAGQDASLASQAANDAYFAAWEKEMAELEQARSAQAEGLIKTEPTSVLQKIKDAIGKESLDLILDLIGVTDVLKCFHGEVSGCLWTAVGLLPIGKAGKLIKAIPAIRKLIGKTGAIKRAIQYSPVKAALDDALIPAACAGLGVATYRTQHLTIRSGVYRTPAPGTHSYATIASKCKYPSTVKPLPNGRYPINGRYAGGLWRNGDRSLMPENWPYGDIPFTKEGFPDFTKHVQEYDAGVMKQGVKPDLTITPTGRRYKDIRAADKALGIDAKYRRENQLVWHHHQDTGRMQLIPRDLHNAVRHSGGYAKWGKNINA
ncbi:HNH endonuclease [Corynebacterium accolens]|uniref:HNH endonuclease n=1 Tax=Corynebacterium accolens TaxID=38284 RepID=UPI002542EE21|nr:HNH endonuclease [Corynebacterium accolens]MDK4331232.1 HNH endonuclease [Corynebacterium accolens]